MNEYIENLNEEDKNEVLCCETESKSLFRFCDSVESKSTKNVNISIVISSNRILVEVDIVKSNILLLISKDIMSKLGMKIDFTKHEAELNGQVIKLQCNSSDHYCIPLTTLARENCNVVFLFGIKLHHLLCHASKCKFSYNFKYQSINIHSLKGYLNLLT